MSWNWTHRVSTKEFGYAFKKAVGRDFIYRQGIMKRIPEHYIKFQEDLKKPSSLRPHEIVPEKDYLDYKKHPTIPGVVERVSDRPLEGMIYPKESDTGIWGGKGVIKGMKKLKKFYEPGEPRPMMWFPDLINYVFYSEILDKYMKVVVTPRTIHLVTEAGGFDQYLLRTPIEEFKSGLAIRLRRKLLLALASKEVGPGDPKIAEKLLERYRENMVSEEEATWFGLELKEAVSLQRSRENEEKPVPLRVVYTKALIEELERLKESGELDSIIEKNEPNLMEKMKDKVPFLKK